MKYLILFLAFMCPSLIIAQPDTLWSSASGGRSDQNYQCVRQLDDSGFIMAGGGVFGDNQIEFHSVRIDETGNEVWANNYHHVESEVCKDIEILDNGDFLLVGGLTSNQGNRDEGFVVRIDSEGEEIWSQNYGGESSDLFRSSVTLSNNTFCIAGYTHSFGENSSDMWLVKIDGAGEVLWQRTYDNRSSEGAETIVHCDDGGFLIAGYTFSDGWSGRDFYVVRTDSIGDELWNASFGDSLSDICYDALQTADGGFLLGGVIDNYPAEDFEDMWLVKIDREGGFEWSRRYGGDDDEYCYSIDQTLDGGYILSGVTSSFGEGVYNYYIVRVDSMGNELWSMVLGERGINRCYSVISTSDGGYALAGVRDYGGGRRSDGWIVKTGRDPLLNNVVLLDPSFPSELKLHTPYPNPFNSTTRIAFQLPYPSHVTLSIHDQQGREVTVLLNQNLTLGKHEVRWQAEDQPSGMYYCMMDADGFRISKGVVFVR